MEESTTDATVQEQAAIESQPEGQHAEAEQTPTSEPSPTEPTNQSTEPAPADNSGDFDYESWLEKKGIDPSTPEGKAAIAKSWREMEKKMHETTQAASAELEQVLTSQPPQVSEDPQVQALSDMVFNLEMKQTARDFMQRNNVTEEQRSEFVKYLTENPTERALIDNGLMSVDKIYKLSGIGESDSKAIEAKGAKQALENLATSQRSTAPSGGASAPSTNNEVDPIMEVLRSND